MKKTAILGLVILVAFSATACKKEADVNDTVFEEQTNNVDYSKFDEKSQFMYGKVKSVVGNEIDFELANSPEGGLDGIEKENEEEEIKNEKPQTEPSSPTPSSESSQDAKVEVGDIEKNKPLVELDFTGESKTIMIPAGASINIFSDKNSTGLDAIKEGTYLRVIVDDNKSESPTVIAVDVIS